MTDEEIKFKVYVLRRFGLHPELIGNTIVFPDIEKHEAERLMKVIEEYQPHNFNVDMTDAINHFILRI
jgi:ATP-dependent protease Clp ATPase subunit